MANILSDGTVLASWMSAIDRGVAEPSGMMDNLALRQGEVKAILYSDDPLNQNGHFIEYDVEVQHRDSDGPGVSTIYRGCTLSNLFGGAADLLRYTLRADDGSNTGADGLGVGSKVLLLCVNGQQTFAVILGGIRDTKVDQQISELKKAGHNLAFVFNGTGALINDAGELLISRLGATKVDGTLDSNRGASSNNDSHIDLTKDGSLEFYTHGHGQSILLDNKNSRATFTFAEWGSKVDGPTTLETGKDFTLKAGQNVLIKSTGVKIGDATDATLLGATFRRDQQQLHLQMVSALTEAIGALTVATVAISAAAAALATPIVGGPIASPLLVTAGVSLGQATSGIGQVVSAISTYEGKAAAHLSKKNSSD